MSLWIIAPKSNKLELIDMHDAYQGSVILYTLQSIIGKEISNIIKVITCMNESKVDQIEDQLVETFKDYIVSRKLDEEELKKSYVF